MEFPSLYFRFTRSSHGANPQESTRSSRVSLVSRAVPFLSCLGLTALMVITRFPISIWFIVAFAALIIRFFTWIPILIAHPLFRQLGEWRTMGAIGGAVFFAGITLQADPATAQLFNSAEQQATSIFGTYIDGGIITFLFGLLRIVVWITAVGFVLFSVYQAQRGEQWQPLMQNAFIVVAAVVVVEGLSALFFGGSTTATPTNTTPGR